MLRQFSTFLALLVAASAGVAGARPRLPKVMVLDFPAAKGFNPSVLKTMDNFLAGAVRDQGFAVVTPSQIGAVLGIDRQRQLLGCTESSCLAELSGALGVDFIVSGTTSLLDADSAAITLTAVNQKGILVGSERKIVDGTKVSRLLAAFDTLVPRLMNQTRGGLASPPVSMAPAQKPLDVPSRAPELASPDASLPAGGLEVGRRTSRSHPTGSYVLAGAGLLLVAASVVVGLTASASSNDYENDIQHGLQAEASADSSSTRSKAVISTLLTGVGTAALAGGTAWWFAGASSKAEAP